MRKQAVLLCLASIMAFGSSLPVAAASESRLSQKSYAQPEDLGPMVQSVTTLDSAFGVEDGVQVVYTTSSGTPAVFSVIDPVQNKLLRSFPLPGSGASWSHTVDRNGNVYIGGTGKMFRYSPSSKTLTDLGYVLPGARETYGLSTDDSGNVYGGVYPQGKVFQYQPATGAFRDYGSVQPGQDYVRSLAYANGKIYAGIGTVGALFKIDPATGEKTNIPFPERPEYTPGSLGFVYDLNVVGSYLFVHVSSHNLLFVYDLNAEQWLPLLISNYKGLYTSPEWNGKTYFVADNFVKTFDLTTHEIADTGIGMGTYFRHAGWIEFPNDPDFPGKSLVTITFGGPMFVMNFTTGKTKSLPAVAPGQPIAIQALEKGTDNKLYMSGYLASSAAQYDPATGEKTIFGFGQAEGMVSSGSKMYFGEYPGANLYEMDQTKSPQAGTNPKLIYDIGDEQDRPFAMTVADNKLIAGTIPTYGQLGGAVTVLPLDGSSQPKVYRNVVQDQSVIGIAYRDGKIYGSTSVWGGLGIEPTQSEAKLFVMDAATGQKLAESTPVLPNAVKAKAIGGLSFGPDNLLWGAAYGTIFAVDPATLKVVKSKEISATDWVFDHYWRPVYLRWSQDGLLYTTLGSKITVIDPATLEYKTLEQSGLMTLGADGHIYYADAGSLKRIKVTNEAPKQFWDVPLPLQNAGFEEAVEGAVIPGWQPFYTNSTSQVSYAVSSERKASGSSSLRLIDTATNEGVAVISTPLSIRPGVEYTAAVKLFIESGRTSFVMRFYDAAGKQVGEQVSHVTTGLGGWQDVILKGVAPDNAATVRVLLSCSALWMTKAYYDNVSLTYQSPVAPPIVVYPSEPTAGSDVTPVIRVKSAVGTVIKVFNGSELIGTGKGASDAETAIELTQLAEGTYSDLSVIAEDSNGNTSLTVRLPALTVDITAPAAPVVISPKRPQSSNDRNPVVQLTAEAGSRIYVMEDDREVGNAVGQGDTAVDIVLSLPKVGIHKLHAYAVDAAGNQSGQVELPHLIVNNGHNE